MIVYVPGITATPTMIVDFVLVPGYMRLVTVQCKMCRVIHFFL